MGGTCLGTNFIPERDDYPLISQVWNFSPHVDGSEDSAINIEGITDYEVGSDTDSDGSLSDDEDPFADLD